MADLHTIFTPNMVSPSVFSTTGAVKVTVFGLRGKDSVHFRLIRGYAERPNFQAFGCFIELPTPEMVVLAETYTLGTCIPTLNNERNTLFIANAGKYLPIIDTSDSDSEITITVEPVEPRYFSDTELGIAPCVSSCTPSDWQWSGRERADGDKVEREYISDCGTTKWEYVRDVIWWETGVSRCVNHHVEQQEQSEFGLIRWKETETECGYSPSVAVRVVDECGVSCTGYMYHPDEPRPAGATVGIPDCNGKFRGYIFPNAGQNRTLPFDECGGAVWGYLENSSASAPQCSPCGCGGSSDVDVVVNVPETPAPTVDLSGLVTGLTDLKVAVDGLSTAQNNATSNQLGKMNELIEAVKQLDDAANNTQTANQPADNSGTQSGSTSDVQPTQPQPDFIPEEAQG